MSVKVLMFLGESPLPRWSRTKGVRHTRRIERTPKRAPRKLPRAMVLGVNLQNEKNFNLVKNREKLCILQEEASIQKRNMVTCGSLAENFKHSWYN